MFYANRVTDYADIESNLLSSFKEKCYICECKIGKDYEFDHRIPTFANKEDKRLLENWNLFLSCGTCNKIKGVRFFQTSCECKCGNGYLGIIDCTKCDPNKLISLCIDDENTITITEKERTPCTEFTMHLLKMIYCGEPKEKMKIKKLANLIDSIGDQHSKCSDIVRKLKLRIKYNVLEDEINNLVDELVTTIRPDSPFSAFKRTYLEQMCESAKNCTLKSKLKEALDRADTERASTFDCI